jgi:predicted amidophosphoribosyltransferase
MNPAQVLAEGVARELRVEFIPDLLRYRRHTAKQGTLSRQQRIQNVASSMRINSRIQIRGLNILLIDDVMATGATMNEAANTLRRAGVSQVSVAVVARGTGSM